MHWYWRLLAVACSVTSKTTSAHHGAAVLATVPVFLVLYATLSLVVMALFQTISYVVFLVTALAVGFTVFEVNLRALQTHRQAIQKLQHRWDTRWYLLLFTAAYLYLILLMALARAFGWV